MSDIKKKINDAEKRLSKIEKLFSKERKALKKLKKKQKRKEKGKEKVSTQLRKRDKERRKKLREEREKRRSDDSSSESSISEREEEEIIPPKKVITDSSIIEKDKSGFVRGVYVIHPTTGNKIKVSDASNRHNRGIWNYAQKAFKEGEQGGPESTFLAQLIKQAMQRGMRFNDYSKIPEWVVKEAKELLRGELGEQTFNDTIDTEEVSETIVESFHGSFQKNQLTMGEITAWTTGEHNYMEDLANSKGEVVKILKANLASLGSHRVYIIWRVYMGKTVTRILGRASTPEEEVVNEEVQEMRVTAFSSSGETGKMEMMRKDSDAEEITDAMFGRLIDLIERYVEHGSGWQYLQSLTLDIYSSKQLARAVALGHPSSIVIDRPVQGGSWCKLPKWLRNRRVANPKPPNAKHDHRCFIWAILRSRYPRPSGKKGGYCGDILKKTNEVQLPKGLSFPVTIDDRTLKRIESVNDFTFSVFALGEKEGEVIPLYVSEERKTKAGGHYLLGLVDNQHFVSIPSLSKILRASKTVHYCENCLASFNTIENAELHMTHCMGLNEPTAIKMPELGSRDHRIIFNNWQYKLPAPFVIYADIEALLKPQEKDNEEDILSKHKPIAWAYKIVCRYAQHEKERGTGNQLLSEVRLYCGPESMHKLLTSLYEDSQKIEAIVNTHLPYQREEGDIEAFQSATECHICGKQFNSNSQKVRTLFSYLIMEALGVCTFRQIRNDGVANPYIRS